MEQIDFKIILDVVAQQEYFFNNNKKIKYKRVLFVFFDEEMDKGKK